MSNQLWQGNGGCFDFNKEEGILGVAVFREEGTGWADTPIPMDLKDLSSSPGNLSRWGCEEGRNDFRLKSHSSFQIQSKALQRLIFDFIRGS